MEKFAVLLLLITVALASAAELSRNVYGNIPKAKRLEETKNIKDYVESGKERAPEHPDHTHKDSPSEANPKSAAHGKAKYQQEYQDHSISGESSPYNFPTHASDDVLIPIRRVEDTKVECKKTHMIVTFKFSSPFNGYIYPYNKFGQCVLHSGQNSHEVTLTLHHGTCGQKRLTNANDPHFSPTIEHRLMIQWEREFMGEDDSSIIVRCDRPDDFNKTIEWNFRAAELASTLERNTHPGPRMTMEIQRGEGPNAPPLDDHPTFLGDVLTIVFTLSDEVFWFGSNVLSCTAIDGGDNDESVSIQEVDTYSPSVPTYPGKMTVIENECSTKPKLFSHLFKERITRNGNLVNIHYAHFKAFRFPTSSKVVLQCNVQVCYKNCEPLPPCSVGFQPRAASQSRNKREVPSADNKSGINDGDELDTVLLYRTIEVFSAEDGALREIPVTSVLPEQTTFTEHFAGRCYSSQTFFSFVGVLSSFSIFLLIILSWNMVKSKGLTKCDDSAKH